jgi:4-amino-4-deoxy-L-arabinose transferase-like glycosyltransferase
VLAPKLLRGAALALLLAAGLALRAYHLSMPSIGMHAMKENEYLSQAEFMEKTGDLLRRQSHWMGLVEGGTPYFEEYPQIPLLSWTTLASWKVLGRGFAQARLPIVASALGAILALYFVAMSLTGDPLLAIGASALLTIAPVHVFFGRNLQPDAPALLAVLLATQAFLKWREGGSRGAAFATGVFLGVAGLLKYTFLIAVVPLAFLWPFREGRVPAAQRRRAVVPFALGLLPLLLWSAITPLLNTYERSLFEMHRVDLFEVFRPSYWRAWGSTIGGYSVFEYTPGILALFVAGVLLLSATREEPLARRWVLGWCAAAVPYGMLLSSFLRGHGYYQMPFAPAICLGAAAALALSGRIFARAVSRPALRAVPFVLVALLLPGARRATARHFDTIYFGLDAAADYLKQHSEPAERVFVFGHQQATAACYNADRLCGWAPTAADIDRGEATLDFRWALVSAATGGLDRIRQDPAVLAHLQDGYELVQLTFFPKRAGGVEVETALLRKGGRCDLVDLSKNPLATERRAIRHPYETTRGWLTLLVVEERAQPPTRSATSTAAVPPGATVTP